MMDVVPRVVLLLPTATYRAPDFVEAATALGIDVVVGSERRQALAGAMRDRALVVPFGDPERAAAVIVDHARRRPVDAVVAVDEAGVLPAALASEELGLSYNPPDAVAATRDKGRLRRALATAGIPQPDFRLALPGDDVGALARAVGLPCVVKAASLSASRGVLRADTPEAAVSAAAVVRDVLRHADTGAEPPADPEGPLLVESYVGGAEVAVEGLLTGGRLHVLALFDKPDPMDGPTFEETILVTPSRLDEAVQQWIGAVTAEACHAVGLREGPVHAEVRVDGDRVAFLEVAARSIGGLCARTLRFGTGSSLEELILRHATGMRVELDREREAAGVLMLPTPRAGVLEEIRGEDDARAVPGVVDVQTTVRPGTEVRPLPYSSRYLGFVFARASSPGEVEGALREAWGRVGIVVTSP